MFARKFNTAALAMGLAMIASTAGAQVSSYKQQTAAQIVPQVATTSFSGSFIFNFVITIKSGIPATGYPIICSATVAPLDISSGLFFSDTKAVTAVRSGNTATCNFSVPYTWALSSGSTMVNTTYQVMSTGTANSLVERLSTGELASVVIPANGTSLAREVAVTF